MNKIASSILALYVASLLYLEVPFVKTLTILGKTSSGLFVNHLAIFLVFFIFAYFIFNKLVLINPGSGAGKSLKLVLLAAALVGGILTVFYHVLPIAPVYALPHALDPFFVSDTAYTVWLVAPLIVLFF